MTREAFYIPPEWARQSTVWVGWPHLRGEWGGAFDGARLDIATFVRAVSEITPVRIACGSREAYGSAWFALEPEIRSGRVSLHTLPAGDIWLRDTGPIIAVRDSAPVCLQFKFNGWGGKYVMSGDTMTSGGIASVEFMPRRAFDFVLEGGAVDFDGAGRVLTTRECLLNPNRNPDWTQADAENALSTAFGVETVIWLGDGLRNDHTDGHIDNLARFIGPGRVVCQSPSGRDDPNADRLEAIENELRANDLEVLTVPSPGLVEDEDGMALPASHMNFLISNQTLYLPTYEDTFAPQAKSRLQAYLPDYQIIDLPARHILAGGGAFHCMTQQIPALEELSP